jgi:hypothetical protein
MFSLFLSVCAIKDNRIFKDVEKLSYRIVQLIHLPVEKLEFFRDKNEFFQAAQLD